jgi:hypothetical protein
MATGMAHIELPGQGVTNDWWTPREIVKSLGSFDLDPCAGIGQEPMATQCYYPSPEIIEAEAAMTAAKMAKDKEAFKNAKEEYENALIVTSNGLNLPWDGRVFCNPPYGPYVGQWVDRLAEHNNGILLIFARTETRAWQKIWKTATGILIPFRRITFLKPNGEQAKSGTAPSAFAAYGENNLVALANSGIKGALLTKWSIQ